MFDTDFVTSQLKVSSVFAYHKLVQEGFPIHTESNNLRIVYELTDKKLLQKDFFDELSILLRSTGLLHRTDFKIGKSKIFFRPIKSLNAILNPSQEMIRMTKANFERKIRVPKIWNSLKEKLIVLQERKNPLGNT